MNIRTPKNTEVKMTVLAPCSPAREEKNFLILVFDFNNNAIVAILFVLELSTIALPELK